MGVYIPGMEMPKDRGVYIAIDIDGQVYIKDSLRAEMEKEK